MTLAEAWVELNYLRAKVVTGRDSTEGLALKRRRILEALDQAIAEFTPLRDT